MPTLPQRKTYRHRTQCRLLSYYRALWIFALDAYLPTYCTAEINIYISSSWFCILGWYSRCLWDYNITSANLKQCTPWNVIIGILDRHTWNRKHIIGMTAWLLNSRKRCSIYLVIIVPICHFYLNKAIYTVSPPLLQASNWVPNSALLVHSI